MDMAKQKRNILDDVTDGVRQLLDDLDRLLNPDKHQKPVRVPVPVRPNPTYPPQRRDNNHPY
jgi:hypothetical protein